MTTSNRNRKDNSRVQENIRVWAPVIFSAIVICVALFIILSNRYTDEYSKWAFSMVGVIMGYWLAPVTRKES